MKPITSLEFNWIQLLPESDSISQSGIEFYKNGIARVTVISEVDADWNAVDRELENIFPGMEYTGAPAQLESGGEFYFIDFNGETLINLIMKKAPSVKEAVG